MKNIITIDFETYYDKEYSLSKLTTQQYIDDPRFEVIGVAVNMDGVTTWVTKHVDEFLSLLPWGSSFALAHNALFDLSILAWRYNIKPYGILDTLSMARAVHGIEVGNSLARLSEFYGVGQKGTEVIKALGKHKQDFTREELAAYGGYCKNDVKLTLALFQKLLSKFSKQELKLIDMTVRMHSEPQFVLDKWTLEEHLDETRKKKIQLLTDAGVSKDDLMSNNKFADVLASFGVEPPTKISLKTGKEAFAFAKTDEAFKELANHPDERIQAIVAARLGSKSTLEETRTERLINIARSRTSLPVPLKYYKAHTGRWGGSDAINLQNLPRKSKLKEAIQAPEGQVIVSADLSNIELRMGLWFSGQFNKLKLLAEGKDLYKDFASQVFNVPYEDVDAGQRFIGKTSQLSLIFGVGAKKIRNAIKQDPKFGTDIGEDEAFRIVQMYRSEYHKVKQMWYKGKEVLEAIRDDCGMMFGFLEVHGKEGIRLPSGLYLRYLHLQEIEKDGNRAWVYKRGKETIYVHGAKCYQNCIQSLARCVMSESMVRINKEYPIALTIHDALYILADERFAEISMEYLISEMIMPPKWAAGLPLAAEGKFGRSLAEC